MIEKNIRLQPHHARDLLVGRRSDGRRPGYQPPGHGTGGGRGRDNGGGGGGGGGPPGGGDRQMSYSAPAPAPAPARVSPMQSMAMTGNTSLAGKTQSQAKAAVSRGEGKVDVGFQEALKKTEDIRQREEEFLDTGDYDVFADTRLQPGPKVDIKDIVIDTPITNKTST